MSFVTCDMCGKVFEISSNSKRCSAKCRHEGMLKARLARRAERIKTGDLNPKTYYEKNKKVRLAYYQNNKAKAKAWYNANREKRIKYAVERNRRIRAEKKMAQSAV